MTTERDEKLFDTWLRNSVYYDLDAELIWDIWKAVAAEQAENIAILREALVGMKRVCMDETTFTEANKIYLKCDEALEKTK